jgi:hypothetical protein
MSKKLRRKKPKKYLKVGDSIYYCCSNSEWVKYEIVKIYKYINDTAVKVDLKQENDPLVYICKRIYSNILYLKQDLNTRITDNCFNLKLLEKGN